MIVYYFMQNKYFQFECTHSTLLHYSTAGDNKKISSMNLLFFIILKLSLTNYMKLQI